MNLGVNLLVYRICNIYDLDNEARGKCPAWQGPVLPADLINKVWMWSQNNDLVENE